MFNKDTLQLLNETAIKSTTLKELAINDPRRRLFSRPDGGIETIDLSPALRSHTVESLEDFIAAIKRCGKEWSGQPVVWHDEEKLVLVIDDADRRDVVTLKLEKTPQFQTLLELAEGELLPQPALRKVLRIDLHDCVTDGMNILNQISKVKFRSTESVDSNMQRAAESMDLDVSRDVLGLEGLPEIVQVNVCVYANPGELSQAHELAIGCALDPDIGEKKFYFATLPGELDVAVQKAQASLRERIVSAIPDVAIFNGKP